MAERPYPLLATGTEFVNTYTPNMSYVLDDDFSTSCSWTPWYVKEKPSPQDEYSVFVIALK